MLRIGLIGDYNTQVTAHIAIPQALERAAHELAESIEVIWLPTPTLAQDSAQKLANYQALWATPNTPYASMEGVLQAIRFAREQHIPFLGTCGGFQHTIIEFARNALGITNADHAESNPEASNLLVTPLACSLNEMTLKFTLLPGSRAATIYGQQNIIEQYGICNYGLNPDFQPLLERNGLLVSGVDDEQRAARIIELEQHPFFMATLFQPERSALKNLTHPLIKALLQAAQKP